MLEEIKARLQITGDYMDAMLNAWISDTVSYMINAGVDPDTANLAYGVIAKGVWDMWNRDSFSPIFHDMLAQLMIGNPNGSITEDV